MPVNPANLVDSLARHSFGFTLWHAPWIPDTPDTFTEVGAGALLSANLNGRSLSDVKITHAKSPEFAHEYMPGILEGGTLELRFHYHPNVLVAIEGVAGLLPAVGRTYPDHGRRRWRVVDAEANYFAIFGYIHPPEVQYEEDQPIAIVTRIKVAKGKVTFVKVEV